MSSPIALIVVGLACLGTVVAVILAAISMTARGAERPHQMHCPECNTVVSPLDRYCPSCGKTLRPQEIEKLNPDKP